MRNVLYFSFLVLLLSSCKTFSKVAANNSITPTKDGYIAVTNDVITFELLTFGDFEFASSKHEYKKLNREYKPMYRNIIVYGVTKNPSYEFYVVVGKLQDRSYATYYFKSIKVDDKYISLAISKEAPASDVKFIMDNLKALFESEQ